jgi:hypothetical protein
MNGILCMGGGRGCVPVTISESGEGTAGVALSATKRTVADAAATSLPADPEPPASYWPPAKTERSPNLVPIPADTNPERCTGAKCNARKEGPALIFKVKHPKTGNLTPAAIEPYITLPKDGAVVPTGAFGPYLDAAPGRESIKRAGMGYSHFIDCPDSAAFKRK